jgi:hypothetical protein
MFFMPSVMEQNLKILMVNTANPFKACYARSSKPELHFNIHHLGYRWFEQGITEDVDRLLIHEFGHQSSGDHLSADYHEALCLLGARLKRLALEKPEAIRQFMG